MTTSEPVAGDRDTSFKRDGEQFVIYLNWSPETAWIQSDTSVADMGIPVR